MSRGCVMCQCEIVSERILELIERFCVDEGRLNREKAKGVIMGCLDSALPQEECCAATGVPALWD